MGKERKRERESERERGEGVVKKGKEEGEERRIDGRS